jgi:RNA-directed DNA polymerase
VNTGAPWPTAEQAKARVLEMQTKLHRWAGEDEDRRFDDVFNLVHDPAFLAVAWARVKRNVGGRSAGVDGNTASAIEAGPGAEAFLGDLRAALKAGTFRPLPVRERMIPKPGTTKRRRLGIPTVRDRVVQAALKLVLEPIFERDFKPCSYGFRSHRRAQDAIAEIQYLATRSYEWVLEADIEACLVPSSHCLRVHGDGVEEHVGGGKPDSQALSAAAADVNGVELAALDTLQHGLSRDAEGAHGVDDRHEALRCLLDE